MTNTTTKIEFQRVPNGISVRGVVKAKDVLENETFAKKQYRLAVAQVRAFAAEFPDVARKIIDEMAGMK